MDKVLDLVQMMGQLWLVYLLFVVALCGAEHVIYYWHKPRDRGQGVPSD